eukprot:15364472-Ditylum_brightwellii.AAC.3
MTTKHTAAVIIQTNFCQACQQPILYYYNDAFIDWNNHDEFNNEKKKDKDLVNGLISSFILDLDIAMKTFVAISQTLNTPETGKPLISATALQKNSSFGPDMAQTLSLFNG